MAFVGISVVWVLVIIIIVDYIIHMPFYTNSWITDEIHTHTLSTLIGLVNLLIALLSTLNYIKNDSLITSI